VGQGEVGFAQAAAHAERCLDVGRTDVRLLDPQRHLPLCLAWSTVFQPASVIRPSAASWSTRRALLIDHSNQARHPAREVKESKPLAGEVADCSGILREPQSARRAGVNADRLLALGRPVGAEVAQVHDAVPVELRHAESAGGQAFAAAPLVMAPGAQAPAQGTSAQCWQATEWKVRVTFGKVPVATS
jgi:hypothetical protein